MKEQKALRYGFVQGVPASGATSAVVDASDPVLEPLPIGKDAPPDAKLYAATLQILNLWIDDLPDWGWGANEGLLKLTGKTRRADQPDEKLDLASTLSIHVKDERRTLGFELGFTNVLFKNRLILGFELTELDKGAKDYYEKITEAIGGEAGAQILDVLKPVPYLQLATKVASGLIKAFGDDHPDKVWGANPMFAVDPLAGAPYLRSGIYVAYEDAEGNLRPDELTYTDQMVARAATGKRLDRNYLVFSMGIEAAQEEVAGLLKA